MVISRKVVAQLVASVLTWVSAYFATKAGLHIDAASAELISSIVGVASGAIAGWLVKEIPDL